MFCSIPVFEKLTREKIRLWHAQVGPAIRAAQLEGFIDGTERAPEKTLNVKKDSKKMLILNPNYAMWCVCDQYVLTYLVTSLSMEVLVGITSNTATIDMWAAISKIFSSESRSCVLHLRNWLVAAKKKGLSITAYFSTMCGYADEIDGGSKEAYG
jgi:hypothetical protein